MQPHEIISLFSNLKAVAEQTGAAPMTDQALATLTVGCILDSALRDISQDIVEWH